MVYSEWSPYQSIFKRLSCIIHHFKDNFVQNPPIPTYSSFSRFWPKSLLLPEWVTNSDFQVWWSKLLHSQYSCHYIRDWFIYLVLWSIIHWILWRKPRFLCLGNKPSAHFTNNTVYHIQFRWSEYLGVANSCRIGNYTSGWPRSWSTGHTLRTVQCSTEMHNPGCLQCHVLWLLYYPSTILNGSV
jgi:hypothetical protein